MFWGLLAAVLIAITGIWGYNRYMEKKKVEQLYQHGFQLLEEQIATYIKENYSGVRKIEFSPIYIDGDGRFTMRTAEVVPILYDEHGNKAQFGGKIDHFGHPSYGILNYLRIDWDIYGTEIIELASGKDYYVEVAYGQSLPEATKWTENENIDNNIQALIDIGELKGIEKSAQGSPSAEIRYNVTFKKGILKYDTDR
ncbi:hypothetical protein DDV21_002620 [Streptococcus chenjunshii]|uniref:Uncharacterized protein n=2 Tax=Streptococcus chenjunshii TaxID=2173853 RepID=A0A372KK74_9STRE|nr:hypothetical protein DDV21_002620 [Streptococcus chenjunshii]RFU50442.1 hypothetical protein DDV22_08675 [Streptococcus chenjunshii]RFU52670.1 hypothetical protein DDV23_08515 [Streptococcus chenjunshii]